MHLGFTVQAADISIHALREEGDSKMYGRTVNDNDFYPRPPRGGRRRHRPCREAAGLFLSTPSARRATQMPTFSRAAERFLSTPSARRATQTTKQGEKDWDISIHALREEGDSRQASSTTLKSNFYPRPPRGGRRSRYDNNDTGDAFLSTPSARRATSSLFHANASEAISIHALREEGDAAAPTECLCAKISIHALREEGDTPASTLSGLAGYFYPRPPRGGRPPASTPSGWAGYFYPRPPRGGRLAIHVPVSDCI